MLRGWPYRLLTLVEASLLAGIVLALELLVYGVGYDIVTDGNATALAIVVALVAGIYAALAYAVGLAVVGAPVWLVLHRLGWASTTTAMAAGAVGSVIGGAALLALGGAWGAVPISLMLALPGGTAGWVVRAIAYQGTSKPPPAPPA